jgi:hypothetical protein
MATTPRDPASHGDAASEVPLLSGDVWKTTSFADYVIKRRVDLYRDRFETTSPTGEQKTWRMDARVEVTPIKLKERHVRPAKVHYSVVGAVKGKTGEPIELVS